MKGRPDDWTSAAEAYPLPLRTILINATAAGFRGVWVDRAAYADRGARVESTIVSLTGPQSPIVSGDNRLTFYTLQPLQQKLDATYPPARIARAGKALVSPTVTDYGAGFQGAESGPAGTRWRWATQRAVLTLSNPTPSRRVIMWSGAFSATPGTTVRVTQGGRTLFRRILTTGSTPFRIPLASPAGTSTVEVISDGANQAPASDPRMLNLNVGNPVLSDPSLITMP